MKLRHKHILGWVLFIPCLVGVLSAAVIGEYFFWTKVLPGAILCHSCLGAVALLCTAGYYGEKWQDSKTRWKRWFAYFVWATPVLVVVGTSVTGYCIAWILEWQVTAIVHLAAALVIGIVVGFLLLRTKGQDCEEKQAEAVGGED